MLVLSLHVTPKIILLRFEFHQNNLKTHFIQLNPAHEFKPSGFKKK